MLEENGDNATKVKKYDEALATYSIALSLSPSPPNSTLIKWVKVTLVCSSVDEALDSATKVCFSQYTPQLSVTLASDSDSKTAHLSGDL